MKKAHGLALALVVLLSVADLRALSLREEQADVVVYGGTPAGVAAAVAASREGASVLLLEETRKVGGLLSSGLSTAEYHQNWDCFTGLTGEFFRKIGRAYGSTSPAYQWEPQVAERVYNDWLREAKVAVRLEKSIDQAELREGRIQSVKMIDGSRYSGKVFVDASYEGDLLAKAGCSWTVGREPQAQYQEPLAGIRLDPQPVDASPVDAEGRLLPDVSLWQKDLGEAGSGDRKVMVYNFRVILTDRENNRLPLPKPDGYDPARFRMLSGVLRSHPEYKLGDLFYLPARPNGKIELNNRQEATVSIGLLGGQHAWPEATAEERRRLWQEAKDYTLGFLYHLAHDPEVPEGIRREMGRWGLPKDEFTDSDHWPPRLYVRESRRLVGDWVMTQKDILEDRDKTDAVAIGSHWLDCHHVQRVAVSPTQFRNEGRFFVDLKKKPYDIPYRSLLPKKGEAANLLVPVCLSASHVAFSSIRVEETWTLLGQAAGIAAAMASRDGRSVVREVDIAQLQLRLQERGVLTSRQAVDPDEVQRPAMTEGDPAPGKWVRQVDEEWKGTGVYHALYLPTNWRPGTRHPVVVEYAPNRWEPAALTGKVEDCRLGYYQTAGRDFLWVVMPYVDPVKKENAVWWWGSEEATLRYGLKNLRRICESWGGDPQAVFFTGFSRGAIAAGYLGLRNDDVADVWLAFLPHSHIDGGRFTPDGARERLARTAGRPTFITYGSRDDGKNESPKGARILRELKFPVVEREIEGLGHTDLFFEKDTPVRREMRSWIRQVLSSRPGTSRVSGRVVGEDGRGLPNARVQIGSWHWSTTDRDGRFDVPSLVPGRRKLAVELPGWSFPEKEVVVGREDVDVDPIPGTRLEKR